MSPRKAKLLKCWVNVWAYLKLPKTWRLQPYVLVRPVMWDIKSFKTIDIKVIEKERILSILVYKSDKLNDSTHSFEPLEIGSEQVISIINGRNCNFLTASFKLWATIFPATTNLFKYWRSTGLLKQSFSKGLF